MTPTAADDLAHRICATWQRTAPVTEWADALVDLDETAARTAFRRWRNDHREAPTIADLRAMSRQADERAHIERTSLPDPLGLSDEIVTARMQAMQTIIGETRPDGSGHQRELVGRVWRHDPHCARCRAIEARFWELAGG
jgi:hypothetical protein